MIEKPANVLQKELVEIEEEIKKEEKKLKSFVNTKKIIKEKFIEKLNIYNLSSAKNEVNFPLEKDLFSIEAWVPKTKVKELFDLTKDMSISFSEISKEKKDREPTYMENKEFSHLGEDLVNIYDVPSTKDKDPSLWVLLFFSLFFAMIVSDAGYGLLYLLLAFVLKWKCISPRPLLKRFIKLIFFLSCSCIVWGGLTGSFFGLSVSPDNVLDKTIVMNFLAKKKAEYHLSQKDEIYQYWQKKYPKLAQVKKGEDFLSYVVTIEDGEKKYEALNALKDDILMEFSLLIGAIHISISFIRYLRRNWAGIGWIFFIIGGYLYFPSIVGANSFVYYLHILSKDMSIDIGKYILFIGIGLAILLALLQKKIKGIMEVTNVIQVFADILSYLRLYALGLAGMIMATTFNGIGQALPLAVGVLVIIVGHAVNILLCIMGGVIHGLRLNFIEWYHYSFEGDGKLFKPLRMIK